MTGLLASVKSPAEANIVLTAGVDVIDLKDPSAGALGALSIEVVKTTLDTIAGRTLTSATVGDLRSTSNILHDRVNSFAATGVDFVKVGFFTRSNLQPYLRLLSPLADADTKLIGVFFADLEPDLTRLQNIASAGFTGVMIDTAEKHSGGLLRHLTIQKLARFVHDAKQLGLLTGLAGALKLTDIPQLMGVNPDYLGFRTLLCDQLHRTGTISFDAVCAVRSCIRQHRNPYFERSQIGKFR